MKLRAGNDGKKITERGELKSDLWGRQFELKARA